MPVGLGIKLLPEGRGVDEISVLHISLASRFPLKHIHGQSKYRKVS